MSVEAGSVGPVSRLQAAGGREMICAAGVTIATDATGDSGEFGEVLAAPARLSQRAMFLAALGPAAVRDAAFPPGGFRWQLSAPEAAVHSRLTTANASRTRAGPLVRFCGRQNGWCC